MNVRIVSTQSRTNYLRFTFRGDGGGGRFFTFSSLTFFEPSFSERRTKKWLHLSHLTNRVDAKVNCSMDGEFMHTSSLFDDTYKQDFQHAYKYHHILGREMLFFLNHHHYLSRAKSKSLVKHQYLFSVKQLKVCKNCIYLERQIHIFDYVVLRY